MKIKLIGIVSFLSLILVALIYVYNTNIRTRNAVEVLIQDKKMINILVAGSNLPGGDRHRFYSVLSINPENKNIGMTFIPPSFRVPDSRSKTGYKRIDEADFRDFDMLRSVLKNRIKLNIPFYVEFNASDVKRIIDLVEGLDLFILDQYRGKSLYRFGLNYLDGEKVAGYINSTRENSIYLKYDRIQDILLTLYHNKGIKRKFANLKFIVELVKTVKTNLLPQEVLKLSELIYNDGSISTTVLPGEFKNGFYIMDDISYKIYEENFLTSLIVKKKSDSGLKIKILNGTDIPGLARKMRNRLIKDGLTVVEFGTSKYKKMEKSVIILRKGNYNGARTTSKITGINSIHPVIDNTMLHNVLIIIGKDLAE